MKELSKEEKAKAYDEAKEKAKVLKESSTNTEVVRYMDELFPELAESEDEKTRKEILNHFNRILCGEDVEFPPQDSIEEWIAWLEKQGEKGTNGNERKIPYSEQKHADKVEPKFKVGDIITNGKIIGKVDEDGNNKYHGWFGYNKDLSAHYADIPDIENWHLWTIEDAKDGDVLADDVGVILFRKIGNEKYADVVDYYCVVYKMGEFKIQEGVRFYGFLKDETLRPATKEQRERFFATMRDAGYTFDFEKKELKKIEQKPTCSEEAMKYLKDNHSPSEVSDFQAAMNIAVAKAYDKGKEDAIAEIQSYAWSEEDEQIKERLIRLCTQYMNPDGVAITCENWLKTLKDRVHPQPKWNEEDEKIYNRINDLIHAAAYANYDVDEDGKELGEYANITNWLKSLKTRVGCEVNYTTKKRWSEEDERNLQGIIDEIEVNKNNAPDYDLATYDRFLSWLKSLRPQNTWKPSDEQMKALNAINVTGVISYAEQGRELITLFNDLKRLKG